MVEAIQDQWVIIGSALLLMGLVGWLMGSRER